MTDCLHDKIIILSQQNDPDTPDQNGEYWANCLNCKTTMLRPFEDYNPTTKLYDNNYIIYKRSEK